MEVTRLWQNQAPGEPKPRDSKEDSLADSLLPSKDLGEENLRVVNKEQRETLLLRTRFAGLSTEPI